MKCPHCLVQFHDNIKTASLGNDIDKSWEVSIQSCPNCKKMIFNLVNFEILDRNNPISSKKIISNSLIRPKTANRPPVALEVPMIYSNDYNEACLVTADSPKASAALSRRCLQNIIRDELKIKKQNLSLEIDEVINIGKLPSDLLDNIDAIRQIGNFAAHPIKSQSTGEIVEVELHEAEWNLDVLEMLFDYLFVRPEQTRKKRDALNAKLKDLGNTQGLK